MLCINGLVCATAIDSSKNYKCDLQSAANHDAGVLECMYSSINDILPWRQLLHTPSPLARPSQTVGHNSFTATSFPARLKGTGHHSERYMCARSAGVVDAHNFSRRGDAAHLDRTPACISKALQGRSFRECNAVAKKRYLVLSSRDDAPPLPRWRPTQH